MNILRVLTARDAPGDTSKKTGFRPAGFAVPVVLSSSFVVATLANRIRVENLVPTPPESDKCDTKGSLIALVKG